VLELVMELALALVLAPELAPELELVPVLVQRLGLGQRQITQHMAKGQRATVRLPGRRQRAMANRCSWRVTRATR
jgi:hypothetical protein